MSKYYDKQRVKVLEHSKSPSGSELITLEIELHRFCLPENNTHRSISKNYQSSRAVPAKATRKLMLNDTALPVFWGLNQPGMKAKEEAKGLHKKLIKLWWWWCSRSAAFNHFIGEKLKVHKQLVNRVIEPYIYTKGVVTASLEDWEAFFVLRCHKDAQPEIKALADCIKVAITRSKPKNLKYGQWHLPLAPEEGTLEERLKISVSTCAQASYRKGDDSLEKANIIWGFLNFPDKGVYGEDPPHFSPSEHQALCAKESKEQGLNGNFKGEFIQYRKLLERGEENYYIGVTEHNQ